MDIEVGEYVRSLVNGRISKVLEISDLREEPNIKYYKTGKFTGFCSTELYNVKHSPNIIDLIEVGDIVNKKMVTKIEDGYTEGTMEIKLSDNTIIYRHHSQDIKSILTKEQYNANAYRLEE